MSSATSACQSNSAALLLKPSYHNVLDSLFMSIQVTQAGRPKLPPTLPCCSSYLPHNPSRLWHPNASQDRLKHQTPSSTRELQPPAMPYRDLGAELRRDAEREAARTDMLADIRRRVQGNSDTPVNVTQATAPAVRRNNFAGLGFVLDPRGHCGRRDRPVVSAGERSPTRGARDARELARDVRAGGRSARARTASPERSRSETRTPVARGSGMLLVSRRADSLTAQPGWLKVYHLPWHRLKLGHLRRLAATCHASMSSRPTSLVLLPHHCPRLQRQWLGGIIRVVSAILHTQ